MRSYWTNQTNSRMCDKGSQRCPWIARKILYRTVGPRWQSTIQWCETYLLPGLRWLHIFMVSLALCHSNHLIKFKKNSSKSFFYPLCIRDSSSEVTYHSLQTWLSEVSKVKTYTFYRQFQSNSHRTEWPWRIYRNYYDLCNCWNRLYFPGSWCLVKQ